MLCLGFWFTVAFWLLSPILEKFIKHFPRPFSRPLIEIGCTFKIACFDFALH